MIRPLPSRLGRAMPLWLVLLVALVALVAAGCDQNPPEVKPLVMTDLIAFKSQPDLVLNNFEGPERDGKGAWRWALGPQAAIYFQSDGAKDYVLLLEAFNPIPNQTVTLEINKTPVRTYAGLPVPSWLEHSISDLLVFRSKPGLNEITLRFAGWNGHGVTFAPGDNRPLALAVVSLLLYQRPPQ